jgi:quercetin dioxygenase-like cupin family protein
MRYLIAALVLVAMPALALDNGAVSVAPVLTTTATSSGQAITLPSQAKVIVSIYTIPPGATLPAHKHPNARYAYVESGTLGVSNIETGKTEEFKAGEFIVEAIGQWHKAENLGSEPVKLLVIDQIGTNAQDSNVVIRESSPSR